MVEFVCTTCFKIVFQTEYEAESGQLLSLAGVLCIRRTTSVPLSLCWAQSTRPELRHYRNPTVFSLNTGWCLYGLHL
uniref:Uncharacterized protein n=1 Tax=Anguilla anguilla TaxID=7936 RepID=A0A0E9UW79_ANGAN